MRTVWMVLRRPGRLGFESANPSYRDAQIFRWIIVFVAAAPLCAAVLIARWIDPPDAVPPFPAQVIALNGMSPGMPDFAACLLGGENLWPVPSIAILLFFAGISGAQTYFAHPRSIPVTPQNRAIALTYYSCVPLILILPVSISIAIVAFLASYEMVPVIVSVLFGFAVALISWIWPLICMVRVLSATTRCSTSRTIVTFITLPMIWLVLAALSLGLFPVICGFIRLMVMSYFQ